tara:strand:- start:665 stop:1342 length:678 start_codon:yes stop_codon:yes gene_type:complete
MNKSLLTNIISALIASYGLFFSPYYSTEIAMAGLFALSGGLTNWLAIHMLFERIPFLYGSGVIPNRFEEFKEGLKHLIMNEFFSKKTIENFLDEKPNFTTEEILKKLDSNLIFYKLVEAIEESSLGSMLKMVGGKKALDPLKEPVQKKIEEVLNDISSNKEGLNEKFSDNLYNNIENIVEKRLDELTPEHIKIIMKEMIHKHLGWLVVWGGFFGFLIGSTLMLLI